METEKKPKNGVVKANGEVIRRLREDKGWRPEDLADKARLSKRTIETVENGGRVYLATIKCVADALDVKSVGSLIERSNPGSNPFRNPARVTIIIEGEYDGFEGSGTLLKLLNELKAIIDNESQVKVEKVGIGSVIVVLTMSENDAKMLLIAAKMGMLTGFSIESITVQIIDHMYRFSRGGEATKDQLRAIAVEEDNTKILKDQFDDLIAAFPEMSVS